MRRFLCSRERCSHQCTAYAFNALDQTKSAFLNLTNSGFYRRHVPAGKDLSPPNEELLVQQGGTLAFDGAGSMTLSVERCEVAGVSSPPSPPALCL